MLGNISFLLMLFCTQTPPWRGLLVSKQRVVKSTAVEMKFIMQFRYVFMLWS